ncbi:MAG: hypothetical protein IJ054_08090, partial [Lachnospiraceae bacterium]|nr:hypothetical protein [Lachnospiraceae bacterium]
SKSEKIWVMLIVISVITASAPLFSSDLFWGADAPAHLLRLEGTKDALLNKQFPVFIFPKNNNGYGLLGYMYPELFLYVPALLRILRVSIPLTFNLLYLFINVLTAAAAYIGSRGIFTEKRDGCIFVILYLLIPYRLENIYTRADYGETLAMAFIPLVLSGIYLTISENCHKARWKAIIYITLGMTGLINSHILSTVMVSVIAVFYAVVFIRRIINKDSMYIIGASLVFTAVLNIGYIIPFIKMYSFGLNISNQTGNTFGGKYSLIELIGIHDFSIGTAWGGISLIGVAGLILFICNIWCERNSEKNILDLFMRVSFVLAVVLFTLVSSWVPWAQLICTGPGILIKTTGILQFAFRFMSVAAPLITLGTVYYLHKLPLNWDKKRMMVLFIIVLSYISVIPGIFGEIIADPYMNRLSGGASRRNLDEYWPEGASEGMFNDTRLYWSSEDLLLSGYSKDGIRVEFDYYTLSDNAEWVEPPVLYYPGYKAFAETADGTRYPLGVSQGYKYRARIDLPSPLSGSHVKMYYGGIWYFYIGYAISILTAMVFSIMVYRTLLMQDRDLENT